MTLIKEFAHHPVGGRLSRFRKNWEKVTQDSWVLQTVQGLRLEFFTVPRYQVIEQPKLDVERSQALSKEVNNLCQKRAIIPTTNDGTGFVSPVFIPKTGEKWRSVINLKALNVYVVAPHFKMESVRSVKGLIQKDDWLTKLDLKDAYLTVPVLPCHQKYLRFCWQGQMWQFAVLPFGLNSAPFIFTKLMKPVVATLRKLGIWVVLYLDDMLIMANSQNKARDHYQWAIYLLKSLGFILNIEKSMWSPRQQVEFLGFRLDSKTMTILLPAQKLTTLLRTRRHLAEKTQASLREISQVLGTMVATHPAILPASLHYRHLERTKTHYLSRGVAFDDLVPLNEDIQSDLKWWIQEANSYKGRPLQITHWDLTIESNASKQGRGASCQGTNTGGPWTATEQLEHINYLEMKAAFLALQSFCTGRPSVSVLLMDNVTAIAFLNKMGGNHSHSLLDLAKEVWMWCIKRKITIHAEHLPGSENIRADWESRHLTDSSDWKLHREIFLSLDKRLGPFSIDLFASRMNTQLPLYCSWRPDPTALAVDALSILWGSHHPYMFPCLHWSLAAWPSFTRRGYRHWLLHQRGPIKFDFHNCWTVWWTPQSSCHQSEILWQAPQVRITH